MNLSLTPILTANKKLLASVVGAAAIAGLVTWHSTLRPAPLPAPTLPPITRSAPPPAHVTAPAARPTVAVPMPTAKPPVAKPKPKPRVVTQAPAQGQAPCFPSVNPIIDAIVGGCKGGN